MPALVSGPKGFKTCFLQYRTINNFETLLKSVADSSVNEIEKRKIADRLGKRILARGKFMKTVCFTFMYL